MIIFSCLKKDFMEYVKKGIISNKVYDAYKSKLGKKTKLSQIKSWANSLPQMAPLLEDLPDNIGISIEFNIPLTSKRVDFVISGYDEYKRAIFICIELKQWSYAKDIKNSEKKNKKISKFLKTYDLLEKVKVEYDEEVFGKYTINKELEDLNNSKVWLKCGGYIVIDKTEALTAIDINSGKCVGKNNLEDTLLKVNEEATKEIAKQIRLRDIGGIIIVDYIDMSEPKSKERIINDFEEEIKKDRAKIQVEGFSKLNLLELTRKQMYGKE